MSSNDELNKLAYELFLNHFLKEYENVSWVNPISFEEFNSSNRITKYHKTARLIIRSNILKKIRRNF